MRLSKKARAIRLRRAEGEHDKAMRLAEKALALLHHARMLELSAAETWSHMCGHEPTRSILFRSAAALHLDSGCYERAREIAWEGLYGGEWPVPPAIREELKAVRRKAIRAQEEAERGR